MENSSSVGTGFMAVFAVSGSVVFLAAQVHKRLLSNFMKKMEFEITHNSTAAGGGEGKEGSRETTKKKVRFADEEGMELSGAERSRCTGSRETNCKKVKKGESLEAMPQNWQVMYKGILQYRSLRPCY